MNIKYILSTLAVAGLVTVGTFSFADAQPHGDYHGKGYHGCDNRASYDHNDCGGRGFHRNHYGSKMMHFEMTAEEEKAYKAIMDEYIKESQSIRLDLRAKVLELDALSQNNNASADRITALAQDIARAESTLRNLDKELRTELKEKFGDNIEEAREARNEKRDKE